MPYSKFKQTLRPLFFVMMGVMLLTLYPWLMLGPLSREPGANNQHALQIIVALYATLGFFLILAAEKPDMYRPLLLFTVGSSALHAIVVAAQLYALQDYGPVRPQLLADFFVMGVLTIGVAGFLLPRPNHH